MVSGGASWQSVQLNLRMQTSLSNVQRSIHQFMHVSRCIHQFTSASRSIHNLTYASRSIHNLMHASRNIRHVRETMSGSLCLPPLGLYHSTGVDQAIFGTKFRTQKYKEGTFIQSNSFSMTLIDLSLVYQKLS